MAKIKVKDLPKKKQVRKAGEGALEKVRGGARVAQPTEQAAKRYVVTFGTPTIHS